ncbi:WD domain, G-beta repeat protein [Trichuris suis]|nr:WD domain, G-beta repeat protein [Trichuris suis]
MRCSVECTYVSVGCSAGPFRVDWGRKYIAFCLSRNIYLLQSQLDDDPAHTLNSRAFHADDVTCLKWMMYGSEATDYLLSSALDGDVILWLAKNGRLEPLAKLQQTGRYASALAGVWIQDLKSSFVVGCASRSGLQFWKGLKFAMFGWYLDEDFVADFSPAHYIEYENNPPLCCDIRALDAGILAVSGHTDYVCRVHFASYNNDTWTSVILAEICQDWLCSVRFSSTHSSFYLAGGSRDHTIRIWKIRQKSHLCREKCKIVTKQLPIYETGDKEEACFISLDTVIAGHTDAVTSICWNPKNKYQLLSSSMDKTITFWQYNEESDKWEDQGVIGQIDDVEVGFYGAMFSPSGSSVLAHGYQGCLYCWTFTKVRKAISSSFPCFELRKQKYHRFYSMNFRALVSSTHFRSYKCAVFFVFRW